MNPWLILWLAAGVAFGSLFEGLLDNREARDERKRRGGWER